MTLETTLLLTFLINFALVLLDASLGYHLAPHLLRLSPRDEDRDSEVFVRGIRRMLTGVVMLYMFFNCLAYFRQDNALMAVVTVLIVLDLGGQLYVRYRARHRGGDAP
ncbi:MAG: hypothetical protein WBI04_01340 [Trichlorobacter sp.]|jgi:hypothetical protein